MSCGMPSLTTGHPLTRGYCVLEKGDLTLTSCLIWIGFDKSNGCWHNSVHSSSCWGRFELPNALQSQYFAEPNVIC